jgi:hypothetical protein
MDGGTRDTANSGDVFERHTGILGDDVQDLTIQRIDFFSYDGYVHEC